MMVRARVIVALLVGITSIASVAFHRKPPLEDGSVWKGALASPLVGEWGVCDDPAQLDRTLGCLDTALRESAKRLPLGDPAPTPAIDAFMSTFRSWLTNDAPSLLAYHKESGADFSRERAIRKVRRAVDWAFLAEPPPGWYEHADDGAVFQEVLEAQRASGLVITAIDLSRVRIGLGINRVIGTDEWPHDGMFISDSVFVSPAGVQEGWESLEDTSATLNALLRIRLADGRIGHVSLCALYDDRVDLWVPIAATIAVYQGARSPWPFAN